MGNRPARLGVIAAFVMALCLSHAPAAFGEVKVFPTGGFPLSVAAGPDGNIWFTDPGTPLSFTGAQIGSVTQAGVVSKYTPGLSGSAWGIAKGSDGNVWFTEPSVQKAGYVKPSEPATSKTECEVPGMPNEGFNSQIAAGPDGNVWVPLGVNGIARVTPACVVTEFRVGLSAEADVCSVAAGPDGNVWFGDCGTPTAVGKITPTGTITEYEVPAAPKSIAAGPDGNLWFTQGNEESIGRITTSGVSTIFPAPTPSLPASIVAGPDGNLWAENRFSQNEQVRYEVPSEGTYKLGFEGEQTGATGEGTLTSGSKSVTGVSTSTGAFSVGEEIAGSGIPAGATITAISGSTLSISLAATASGPAALVADLSAKTTPVRIKGALEKLSTIGAGNVSVIGVSTQRTIAFVGKFSRADVPLPSCAYSVAVSPPCGFEVTAEAAPYKLMRIRPSGAVTQFPLSPSIGFAPFSESTLASDDAGHLWFSVWEPEFGIARFDVPIYRQLNVIVEGPGSVLISPGEVTCPPLCELELAHGSTITLTADPDPEAAFVRWKGCDTANGRQCTVTMANAKAVTAVFMATPGLTLSKAAGSGLGKVTSYPSGILCLANCSTTTAAFKEGAKVKLNQVPSKHFHFVEWLGDCTGSGLCEVTMSEGHEVEALFAEDPKHSLSLTKDGDGEGTVKSLPAGVNCGANCSWTNASFYEGEVVTLTATPSKVSTFEGWSGSCSGTGMTCTVTMSEAKSAEAKFGPTFSPLSEGEIKP
jgi:virginiamycin B lyase